MPPTQPAFSYLTGCGLVVLGGLVFSLGVLCIRGAGDIDAWQYLTWRGLGIALALGAMGLWQRGPALVGHIRRMGGFAWLATIAMVVSQIGFIIAVQATTVAEVFFLFSLAPLMAAVIARPLLGERIGLLGAIAIGLAIGGVLLMSGLTGNASSTGTSTAVWTGRIMSLIGALSFALYTLAIRGARRQDIDPALVACGVLTFVVSLAVLLARGTPLVTNMTSMALAFAHGALVLSVGLVLLSRGSNVVPAVALLMLAQTETIAAPIWAWLFFNEITTLPVIAGGALILSGVVLQGIDGAREAERRRATAAPDAADVATSSR
jgi:drug/metabolite transporter (DMT)-like permease